MVFGEAREPSHTELPCTCFCACFTPTNTELLSPARVGTAGFCTLGKPSFKDMQALRGKDTTKPMKGPVARKAQHGNGDSDSRGVSKARGEGVLFLLAALLDGAGAGALRCILPSLHKRAVQDGV